VVGSNFTAEIKEIRIDYMPVAGAFPSSRGLTRRGMRPDRTVCNPFTGSEALG